MTAPRPCVAEVIRRFGSEIEVGGRAGRVLDRLRDCRTAALGGHVWRCMPCARERIAYNSCRDRHCPGCQGRQSRDWLESRRDEVLPVPHFHTVFTLPGDLRSIALGNPRAMYNLLFDAAAETLRTIAGDPKHLGARVGFFGILHTWGGNLTYHPHVHFVVTGGGISLDGARWIASRPRFLVSGRVLAALFRRLLLEGLRRLVADGSVDLPLDLRVGGRFEKLLKDLARKKWVVDLREPFSHPDHVLAYLARYTHRVAIADGRIRRVDDAGVVFDTKDTRRGQVRPMRLGGTEFLRRFSLHVLPYRFVRIRYYGLWGSRDRNARLTRCRELIQKGGHSVTEVAQVSGSARAPEADEAEIATPIEPADSPRCPECRGRMQRIGEVPRLRARVRQVRAPPVEA